MKLSILWNIKLPFFYVCEPFHFGLLYMTEMFDLVGSAAIHLPSTQGLQNRLG